MSTAPGVGKWLPERLPVAPLSVGETASRAENLSLRADIAALVEAGAILTGVLAASGDSIKILDLEGRILFVNDSCRYQLEAASSSILLGRMWIGLWPQEAAAGDALVRARLGQDSRFAGASPTLLGNDRFWDVRITPVRSSATEVTQILVISRDITEQQQLAAQKEVLAAELEHRIRNILAMVDAIAQQTLRPPATLSEAAQSFSARVGALARAQAILTRTNWSSADIRLVVEEALHPHRMADSEHQFVIQGPSILLSPNRALALVLALHELATNAVKYGALSTPQGRVHLRWKTAAEHEVASFMLKWREEGGPLVVPPSRSGFGSTLLQRVLAAEFHGQVHIDFAPSGIVCRLVAPLV